MTEDARIPSEGLTLKGVGKSSGDWQLAFAPDAITFTRVDVGGQPETRTLTRRMFFQGCEYREGLGLLIVPGPKRRGVRVSAADKQVLRAWLGPPGEAEVAHVVGYRLAKYGFWPSLALVVVSLVVGFNVMFLTISVVEFANVFAARKRPRAWQVLVEATCRGMMAATSAWQVLNGAVHSTALGIYLVVFFTLSALRAFKEYRRLLPGTYKALPPNEMMAAEAHESP